SVSIRRLHRSHVTDTHGAFRRAQVSRLPTHFGLRRQRTCRTTPEASRDSTPRKSWRPKRRCSSGRRWRTYPSFALVLERRATSHIPTTPPSYSRIIPVAKRGQRLSPILRFQVRPVRPQ